MKLLLDTHALLWMITDGGRLGATARKAIQSTPDICWSIVSLWEISIKEGGGRLGLRLAPLWHEWIPMELERNGISPLPINAKHCDAVANLPMHHRDPFDRMLIAQAQVENRALVSRDSSIRHYDVPLVW